MPVWSRFLAAAALGAPLVLLPSANARAGDGGADAMPGGGPDAGMDDDAGGKADAAIDAKVVSDASVGGGSETDAKIDAPPVGACVVEGQPCSLTDKCCGAGAYCGDFGGGTGNQVCGLNTNSNQLSTGCAVSARGGGDAAGPGWLGVVGLFAGVAAARKRRPR